MSDASRGDKACAGLGFSAGAAGIATLSGSTTALSGGMLAEGIKNCVTVAPDIAKAAVLGGEAVAALPALVPLAIVGGLIYAGYNAIRYEMEN